MNTHINCFLTEIAQPGCRVELQVPTVVEIFVVDDFQDTYTIALYLPETFQVTALLESFAVPVGSCVSVQFSEHRA